MKTSYTIILTLKTIVMERNIMKNNIVTKKEAVAIREIDGIPTMSSLRIAEVTGKEHPKVASDIVRILEEAEISPAEFSVSYLSRGKEYIHYLLPEFEFNLVISGYSVKYRAKLIKELMSYRKKETTQQVQLTDMEILSKALTIQTNTILQLENKAAEDKPYMDYAKSISIDDEDCSTRAWVKTLHSPEHGLPSDVGEQMVINLMVERSVFFRNADGTFSVTAGWIKNGHFNSARKKKPKGKGSYIVNEITALGRDRFSPNVITFFSNMTKDDRKKYKNSRKKKEVA